MTARSWLFTLYGLLCVSSMLMIGQNLNIEAEIYPKKVIIREYSSMSWNSTMPTHIRTTVIMNLQNVSVYFKWGNETFSYPTYVHMEPPWTAVLYLNNITRRVGANGLSDTSLQYFWGETKVGQAEVNVIRPPLAPNVSSCILYNWKDVTCTWGPSQRHQTTHAYMTNLHLLRQNLYWRVYRYKHVSIIEPEKELWSTCKGLSDTLDRCTWPHCSEVETFCVQIVVETPRTMQGVLTTQSDVTCYNSSEIVQLDPPRIQDKVIQNVSLVMVILPANTLATHFVVYEVAYKSDWGQEVKMVTSSSEQSTTVTSVLVPFTKYNVSIKVKDANSPIWSDSSIMYFIHAPSSEPCAQPVVAMNAFTISNINELMPRRSVHLYWKLVDRVDYCGPGFRYKVQIQKTFSGKVSDLEHDVGTKSLKTTETTKYYFNLQLDSDAHDIIIIAINNLSQTSDTNFSLYANNTIRIPNVEMWRRALSIVKSFDIVVTGRNKSVTITWKEPSIGVLNQALFWCQTQPNSQHSCQGNIEWASLDHQHKSTRPDVNQISLSLPNQFELYQFGISSDVLGVSTGVIWTNCTYLQDSLADPPSNLTVTQLPGEYTSLYISWATPRCLLSKRGYIYQYILSYCLSDEQGKCPNNESVDEVKVAVDVSNQYKLVSLRSGFNYTIWMYSVTQAGKSMEHSVPVHATIILLYTWVTPGSVVAISILAVIIFCVLAAGLRYILKCTLYKLKKSITINISMPVNNLGSFEPNQPDDYQEELCQMLESDTSGGTRREAISKHSASEPTSDYCLAIDPQLGLPTTDVAVSHINMIKDDAQQPLMKETTVIEEWLETITGSNRLSLSTLLSDLSDMEHDSQDLTIEGDIEEGSFTDSAMSETIDIHSKIFDSFLNEEGIQSSLPEIQVEHDLNVGQISFNNCRSEHVLLDVSNNSEDVTPNVGNQITSFFINSSINSDVVSSSGDPLSENTVHVETTEGSLNQENLQMNFFITFTEDAEVSDDEDLNSESESVTNEPVEDVGPTNNDSTIGIYCSGTVEDDQFQFGIIPTGAI